MNRSLSQVVPEEENYMEDSHAEIDNRSLAALLSFFHLLDKWDRETTQNEKVV